MGGSPASGFDILSTSFITSFGIAKLARGMNHPPIAHPEAHVRDVAPRDAAARYALKNQTTKSTPVMAYPMNPIPRKPNASVSASRAFWVAATEGERCPAQAFHTKRYQKNAPAAMT
jgi:hypothetical protein